MKYNDDGEYKDIYVKAFDTLPIGAIVEFDGTTIPDGWEDIGNDKIKKTSQYIEGGASISNEYGTSQEDGYTQEYINNNIPSNSKIVDLIYPVGSIYMSVRNTSPATLFGGTWVSWGSGRVPVGVDTTQTDFNSVEKTGGNKTSYTFTRPGLNNFSLNQGAGAYGDRILVSSTAKTSTSETTQNVSSLQPYITCYMWKRTA